MSELLLKLGQSWRELALYLGYSEMEVEAVTRAGGGDPGRQVLMLLRVWWMPDCGKEKTQALLNKGTYMYMTSYIHTDYSAYELTLTHNKKILYVCKHLQLFVKNWKFCINQFVQRSVL